MTHPAVQRARELAAKATPGPWRDELGTDNDRVEASTSGGFFYLDYFIRCGTHSQVVADATFIAEARTLLPELARLADELETELSVATTRSLQHRAEYDRVVALNTRLASLLQAMYDTFKEACHRDECRELLTEVRALLAETTEKT